MLYEVAIAMNTAQAGRIIADSEEGVRDAHGVFRQRMTDYPAFRQLGYDCGSGPTESLCGTLANRLKGSGMRWDQENAESIMCLAAIYHSGLWQTYWKIEREAA